MENIIVRMAPSPTGNLHIGTARTALFNFLFARKLGGKFIMRIEDTDKERSTREFETIQMEGFAWLGITYDEFFRQSERSHIYKEHLQKMIDAGSAYISKEEVTEEGKRSEVIRFKNPNKVITFTDIVRGEVTFDTTDLGDFVIAKSVEEPLYHLAVVVDDFLMGVTHIIRGEDHISNTPRHLLIQEALGAQRPVYAHLPLILGKDRSKLSKRHGSTSMNEYINNGYVPSAIVNYLALLGWNPGTEKEIFTMNELIDAFEIEKVQKGGAVFDEEKLRWINKEHLKLLSDSERESEILDRISKSNTFLNKGWSLDSIQGSKKVFVATTFERIVIWKDIHTMLEAGELDYAFQVPQYDHEMLLGKQSKDYKEVVRHIEHTVQVFDVLTEEKWNAEHIKESIFEYATSEGRGAVLWPIRIALSGKEKSPDPFTLAHILGKHETLRRLRNAIEKAQVGE